VNFSFPGHTSFHHFHGDSVIRVANTAQSYGLARARTRRTRTCRWLEGKLRTSTISRKGW